MDFGIFLYYPLFFMHSLLCLILMRNFTAQERYHKSVKYFFAGVNALFYPAFITIFFYNAFLGYLAFVCLVFAENFILNKDKLFNIIGVGSSIIIHFFALRSISIATHSLILSESMGYISGADIELLTINTLYLLLVHIIVLFIVIKTIPINTVKSILSSKVFRVNIISLIFVLTAFFIFNVNVLQIDEFIVDLSVQQIVLPILLLTVFYVMLIFMIMLMNTFDYKQIIQELEVKIDQTESLTNALLKISDIVVEIDVTTNSMKRALIGEMEIPIEDGNSDQISKEILRVIHSEDLHLFEKISSENIRNNFKNGIDEFNLDYRAYRISANSNKKEIQVNDNEFLWHRLKLKSRLDEETGHIVALYTINEVHEEKEAELHLLLKSEIDFLTGAYNKSTFKDKISNLIDKGIQGALFVFDLDNFKSVNDYLGHAYGDEMLVEIYKKLRLVVRKDDFIGRFGGDEFVIFVQDCKEELEISRIASSICEIVQKNHITKDGKNILVSASIGISRTPLNAENYDDLFKCADVALYESKNKGKNTFTFYDESMQSF